MACKRLSVKNIILNRTGIGKASAGLLVVKLRPEDARRVEQEQSPVHGHPLLAARDAGTVFRLGALASGDLVDKGRFADIRNTDNHQLQRLVDKAALLIALQFLRQKLPHGRHEAVNSLSALAVGFENCIALLSKILIPRIRDALICKVNTVENHHARLIRAKRVNIGVPAGQRDTGIDQLTHRINETDILLHLSAGFGHMPGIPLDIHFIIHYSTAPILL